MVSVRFEGNICSSSDCICSGLFERNCLGVFDLVINIEAFANNASVRAY